jgi:hypothetical protein
MVRQRVFVPDSAFPRVGCGRKGESIGNPQPYPVDAGSQETEWCRLFCVAGWDA